MKNKTVLRINFIVTFLGFIDTQFLMPVIALYATELGAGTGFAGLVIGMYSITNTPSNLFFGRLIDRVGHKVPLLLGLLGDALGMFLYSICRIPMHLGFVRAWHGISGGMVGPATMSIAVKYATSLGKGRAMGLYGMSIGLATLVGYALGGTLTDHLGYDSLFYIGGGLVLFGLLLSFLIPRGQPATESVSEGQSDSEQNTIGSLLRRRELVAAFYSIFAQYFSFGGVVVLLPLHVKEQGMSAFHVGMLLATFSFVFVLIQFPSGVLSDKIGRKLPTIAGLCFGMLAIVLLPNFTTFPLLAITMGLYGIGYSLLFPSIGALLAENTSDEERGRATGMFHALLTAGVALGAPVMGWVAEFTGVELGLALSAIAMALAVIVVVITLDNKGRTSA